MNKYKVVQYGCGKMSKYIMMYAIDKGYDIVGAFDIDKNIIGKDISFVIGGNELGIKINDAKDAKNILMDLKPDIVIVSTMSLIKDIEDIFTICANLGINAISTCEEALYPFNSSPKITNKLDLLAKENKCTITASGYQDVFWGNLIYTLAGSTHKIEKIKGSSSYNVEDYGIALAKAHGVGLTKSEFENNIAVVDNISIKDRNKLIENGEFLPSYMWNTNGWLCDKFNLTVIEQTQKCIPIIADENIKSDTLNMVVSKGNVIGMSAVVNTKTKEGIEIESECIGKIYKKDEVDVNSWTILGEPTTNVVISKPSTVELTCATIVNRIKDVINSEPGYIPTSKFDIPKYKL